MELAEFDYALPAELIAQAPLPDRSASRMLVVDRARQSWEDRPFRDLPGFLGPGDCLVLNDSRVFPARLFGRRAGVNASIPQVATKLAAQIIRIADSISLGIP